MFVHVIYLFIITFSHIEEKNCVNSEEDFGIRIVERKIEKARSGRRRIEKHYYLDEGTWKEQLTERKLYVLSWWWS